MKIATLTPVITISSFYKNVVYSIPEILELSELMLLESEVHKFQKMKGTTDKQHMIALCTIIDLEIVKNK